MAYKEEIKEKKGKRKTMYREEQEMEPIRKIRHRVRQLKKEASLSFFLEY